MRRSRALKRQFPRLLLNAKKSWHVCRRNATQVGNVRLQPEGSLAGLRKELAVVTFKVNDLNSASSKLRKELETLSTVLAEDNERLFKDLDETSDD